MTLALFAVSLEAGAFIYSNGFDNSSGSNAALDTAGWDFVYNDSGNSVDGDETSAVTTVAPIVSSAAGAGGSAGYIFVNYGSNLYGDSILLHSTDLSDFAYSDIDSISFSFKNDSASDVYNIALKIDGAWYASDSTYGSPSNAWFDNSVDPFVDTTWSGLTVNVGVDPISTGASTTLPASGTLEEVGLFIAATVSTGRTRIDSVSISATAAAVPEASTSGWILGCGVLLSCLSRRRLRF